MYDYFFSPGCYLRKYPSDAHVFVTTADGNIHLTIAVKNMTQNHATFTFKQTRPAPGRLGYLARAAVNARGSQPHGSCQKMQKQPAAIITRLL